jgi:D-amino-acid dehydrogenase
VTDTTRKVVFARLGERVRVAGMVEIVGRDTTLDAGKIASLRRPPAGPAAGADRRCASLDRHAPGHPTGLPITGRARGGPPICGCRPAMARWG